MKYKEKLAELARLPYFDGLTLGNLFGLSGQTLRMFLTRGVARGQLIRIKRNFYVVNDFYRFEGNQEGYGEFLANIIYSPSYLSLEYVLQKHAILTESVFAYTSVTIKKTKKIVNQVGSYFYTNIKPDLFFGFETVKNGNYRVRQATKAKALFDYLYFAVKPWKLATKELFSEIRLNLGGIGKKDLVEFNSYVDRWGSEKLRKVREFICNP